jgi:hypothetical protein
MSSLKKGSNKVMKSLMKDAHACVQEAHIWARAEMLAVQITQTTLI